MTRPDLERAVLGGLLRFPAAVPDALLVVQSDDFFSLRPVAEAIFRLWSAGKPVELVSVGEELIRAGAAEAIGGLSTLGELWSSQPTGAHVEYHAELLRDASTLLRLEEAAGRILADAREPPAPAAEVLDGALSAVVAVADRVHRGRDYGLDELVDEASARVDQRAEGKEPDGVRTGLDDLDAVVSGLRPSELTVIAARPSVGKTALAIHLAMSAVSHGHRTLFVSLEQSRGELGERILAREARIDAHKLRDPSLMRPEEWARLSDCREDLRRLPLRVDDRPGQTVLRIAAVARRLQARGGLGLLVVDYLQLVDPEDRKAPRQEQVAGISRRLKLLARELSSPVAVLAQLNRSPEARADGRPRLSDLRESGAIEADADVVWLLSRVEGQRGLVDLQVAKNRNGRTGEMTLAFDPPTGRFSDFQAEAFGGAS